MQGDDPVHKTGFNHYSDGCLYEAGGMNKGVMDFIQFHTYPWAGKDYLYSLPKMKKSILGSWGTEGPWTGNTASDYGMDQPILVGEFPAKEFQAASGDDLPNGATTENLVDYLYNNGYAGGFSWSFIPDDWTSNPALEEDILVSTISFY